MKELYTIGHSNHFIERFLELVLRHRIEVLCDVRSVPYSRQNPQFNREHLKQTLKKAEIKYIFLGKELGARTDDPTCYIDGKVDYHQLAKTSIFQEGLSRLNQGIDNYRVALMCAEKDPVTCHRTILICRQLRSENIEIKHILDNGEIEYNKHLEQRLMCLVRVQQDLFSSLEDLIEQSYDRQGQKIAYVTDDPQITSYLERVKLR